ncbi:MAG TPA: hypothetical protein VHR66_16675 [Gemmataceae bacterium]|nr:hypothetical protein [Gemmataceae bacterium]
MDEEADWMGSLANLGFEVQRHLRKATAGDVTAMSQPVAEEAGDTIYGLDKHVEPVIERVINCWPERFKPLILIAEGMGNDGVLLFGSRNGDARYRVIVDPIDGTRGLMYDKRAAWFLAAVGPNLGADTSLSNTFAAVMVELPTSKQFVADYFVAGAQSATRGYRAQIGGEHPEPLTVRPSMATTIKDGFAQVSNFFPGTKTLAAELMERIALRTLGEVRAGRADVFDDQYVSSGGQFVELMMGHDRFCCDLRPLFYDILDQNLQQKLVRGIECHPYDLAGMLVAKQAGVILTDGFGAELDGPLNVHHGMHWCGYANAALRRSIQPVILEWLCEKGISVPCTR